MRRRARRRSLPEYWYAYMNNAIHSGFWVRPGSPRASICRAETLTEHDRRRRMPRSYRWCVETMREALPAAPTAQLSSILRVHVRACIQSTLSDGNYLSITGNAGGLGHVRTKELASACARLGVHDLSIIDDAHLPDGPSRWPDEIVAEHVASAAALTRADAIVTFDGGGVSRHPNHVACLTGVLEARRMRRLIKRWDVSDPGADIDVWVLETVALARKYSGPIEKWMMAMMEARGMHGFETTARLDECSDPRALDDPTPDTSSSWVRHVTSHVLRVLAHLVACALTLLGRWCHALFALTFQCAPALPRSAHRIAIASLEPGAIRGAMALHTSQLVWYRLLWVYLSRYVHINTLRRV